MHQDIDRRMVGPLERNAERPSFEHLSGSSYTDVVLVHLAGRKCPLDDGVSDRVDLPSTIRLSCDGNG